MGVRALRDRTSNSDSFGALPTATRQVRKATRVQRIIPPEQCYAHEPRSKRSSRHLYCRGAVRCSRYLSERFERVHCLSSYLLVLHIWLVKRRT